jgi:TDG/mug DNA glycosylase family protein
VILPDAIQTGLKVVFCGTAVGTASAQAGAYYAGPGNSFWATLHEVGLTTRVLAPNEYRELIDHGIGLTDICKTSSGSDRDVGTDGFDVKRLIDTLHAFAPLWIAFNGKAAAEGALGHSVRYGERSERLGPSRVFVVPSTSGAARRYWDVRLWHKLAELVPPG